MKKSGKTIDVTVIGTEPPCPRCDLLALLVVEAAGCEIDIKLRHISYDSFDAILLGLKLGSKIGTAKHVAQAAGIQIDWDAVCTVRLPNSLQAEAGCHAH